MIRRIRSIHRAALAAAAATLLCCSTQSAAPPAGARNDTDAAAPEEDAGATPELSCPIVGEKTSPGKVVAPEVAETSGIVSSARNEGVYWLHNDSGDGPRAFAVGEDGKLLATLTFDTEKPDDIEDMAIEDVSADESYLYFGDIGDNAVARTELTIHRVAEPKLDGTAKLTASSEKMRVAYSDGPHNAETLLFDPMTKDLLIATKAEGGPSYVHRIGAFAAGTKATTEKIATLKIDLATGGDISRDGRFIAVRNYGEKAFVWMRAPGESLADAFAREPCELPVAKETQGEAFAFLVGNKGTVTLSEGASQALHVNLFR